MMNRAIPKWALILAGGDGKRLQPLTREITGDTRPKQFCPILDGETLLDLTRRRVDLIARSDRQLVVLTRKHEPYYRYLAGELAPDRLVVQPENRGTGPGIVYSLLKLDNLAGDVPLAIFPSDHYISDDQIFVAYVDSAFEITRLRPDLVVLLGIEPDRPDREYGWIEPGDTPLAVGSEAVFGIRRFWEKPPPRVAQTLFERGCLWSSFVMVGRVSAFLSLVRSTAPALLSAFEPARRKVGSGEAAAIEVVYAQLPLVSFSERVLATGSDRLSTVRVKGVEWSDWGHPARVIASLARAGRRPSWLGRLVLASTA
jgi:mannose-1-phosphate guanylyltransferase